MVALLLPWSILIWQLGTIWEINEQYSHGFIVPFLMAYLLLKVPKNNIPADPIKDSLGRKSLILIGFLSVVSLLPIWIIRGANPDWRLLNVIFFFSVLLFTVSCLIKHGGLKVLKHYLFPLLFFIVAIPWPLATDLKLTQWLQTKVSETIVDCLLLMGHKAQLKGTIIDVGIFGQIGVDQACSGINGMQASVVVSLFLGAYFALPLIHRFMLFIAGLITALMMNLLRAFVMSFIKVKGKGHLLDSPVFSIGGWEAPNLHDLAGLIETIAIFFIIFLFSKIYTVGIVHKFLSSKISNWNNLFIPLSPKFSIFVIIFLSATVFGSNLHYNFAEQNMEDLPKIQLALLDEEIVIQEQEIPRQVEAQLHFEKANSYQWQDRFRTLPHPYGLDPLINPDDQYWQVFEANWDSGGACTAILSTHSPNSCMPLTGLTQISPTPGTIPPLIPINIKNRQVLFESFEFAKDFRKLFVFRCFWPYKLAPEQPNLFPRGGYNLKGRIKSAIEGRRNVGGTMLALALANVDSSDTAIRNLQELASHRLFFK